MKITIKDIAKETGLSLATISKYLNNKKIQEKNRLIIEDAINRLDYKPNRTAQLLRSKRSMTIAILTSDIGNYFWGNLISTITQYFKQYDYVVITCSYYHNYHLEEELIQDMISKHVDGIVLLPFNATDKLYPLLQEAGIPVVVIDQIPDLSTSAPVDCVVSDNYGGGCCLANYLISKGHRDIFVMEPILHSSSIQQRISGIQDTLGHYNVIPYIPECSNIFSNHQHIINIGRKRFQELAAMSTHPTAVIFTNYATAMGGLMEANALGFAISEEISIVCFDDDPLFSSMHPPITSVQQDLQKIGETTSEILLHRIEGDYTDFPHIATIGVDFHERKSVKNLTK